MSLLDEVEAIPCKTMVLFFMIDTSGSMKGDKIGAVNEAILNVIPELQDVAKSRENAQIKVAALEFSSGAQWVPQCRNGPVEAEKFQWNYIDAEGTTDFGMACMELNSKLSTKAFMNEAAGSFAPAVFLMSDGGPTDDWESGLAELKKNNWFKYAVKVAVAIGNDADMSVLEAFTGNREAVLETHSAAALKKMIKFVSVRASKVASTGAAMGEGVDGADVKQNEMVEGLKEIKEEAAKLDADSGEVW